MTLPFEMLLRHRYDDALRLCEEGLAAHPGDEGSLLSRARALLCLNRLDEAMRAFEEAAVATGRRIPGFSWDGGAIAAIQWMLGDKSGAMSRLNDSLLAVEGGTAEYVDGYGGASQGLLLWHFAVVSGDAEGKRRAERYLSDRSADKGGSATPWPGAVVQFVLGKASARWLRAEAAGTGEPRRGPLVRRRMPQAVFHIGTARLAAGAGEEYLEAMRECAALPNPVVVVEWFLARHLSALT